MQITLIESEIKQAIKLYLQNNIGLSEKKDIKVDFTATRGAEGLKASIDVPTEGHLEPEKQLATGVVQDYNPPKIEETHRIDKGLEVVSAVKEPSERKSLFANLTV